jgi:hypothetical protein
MAARQAVQVRTSHRHTQRKVWLVGSSSHFSPNLLHFFHLWYSLLDIPKFTILSFRSSLSDLSILIAAHCLSIFRLHRAIHFPSYFPASTRWISLIKLDGERLSFPKLSSNRFFSTDDSLVPSIVPSTPFVLLFLQHPSCS